MAIGARSQAARTYLEKHFESFGDLSKDELIKHALLALRETLGTGSELTSSNAAVAFVSADDTLTILEDEAIAPYVEQVGGRRARGRRPRRRRADAPMGDARATGAGAAMREPRAEVAESALPPQLKFREAETRASFRRSRGI